MRPLPFDDAFETGPMSDAPNPKPSPSDKRAYGSLASLYTAFSTEFARFALEYCVAEGHRVIGDPFSGTGTIGEVGRTLPIQLLLNDLNPFAAYSSTFRTSPVHTIKASIERVGELRLSQVPVSEREAFRSAIRQKLGDIETPSCLVDLALDPHSLGTLLDIHLISLIRIAAHKRLRGSNPTWTKRSVDQMIEPASFYETRDEVLAAATSYTARLPPLNEGFSALCRCGNLADLQIEDGSIDAIVTSPPYPNRTDYFRHYLPAVELLVGGDELVERNLRAAQIGTPLIREGLPRTELPGSVINLIDRVRKHGSYASERYYSKGFLYYFADMRIAFSHMARWLRPSGCAIFVVQDAYYKEIRIPVADLLADVAAMAGLRVEARKDFPVRQALSRLSAKARAATPIRAAVESVMLLRRQ